MELVDSQGQLSNKKERLAALELEDKQERLADLKQLEITLGIQDQESPNYHEAVVDIEGKSAIPVNLVLKKAESINNKISELTDKYHNLLVDGISKETLTKKFLIKYKNEIHSLNRDIKRINKCVKNAQTSLLRTQKVLLQISKSKNDSTATIPYEQIRTMENEIRAYKAILNSQKLIVSNMNYFNSVLSQK